MAATIKDIAERTGLGLATISSYLNGGNVREKNREKIEAAIRELNFEVNELARGLKTNRTYTIGVVIPELDNLFCSQIISGMEDALRKHGYATIICDCRSDLSRQQEAVEFLYRKRVDAIVNIPVDATGVHLKQFAAARKPILLLDRKVSDNRCDSILVDNRAAAEQATAFLLQKGHRKIGIVTGPEHIYTAQERYLGYERALAGADIVCREALTVRSDYTIRGAAAGVKQLLREHPDVTALFAANFEMTMGTMIALNECGLRIPDDLSVVGFDHADFARAFQPPLTVVVQPTELIVQRAAERLLQRLGQTDAAVAAAPQEIYLPTALVVGNSVRQL